MKNMKWDYETLDTIKVNKKDLESFEKNMPDTYKDSGEMLEIITCDSCEIACENGLQDYVEFMNLDNTCEGYYLNGEADYRELCDCTSDYTCLIYNFDYAMEPDIVVSDNDKYQCRLIEKGDSAKLGDYITKNYYDKGIDSLDFYQMLDQDKVFQKMINEYVDKVSEKIKNEKTK